MTAGTTSPERRRAEAIRAAAGSLDVLNIADVDALLRVAAWILGEHPADDDAQADAWLRSMANLPDEEVRALLVNGGWLPADEKGSRLVLGDRAEQAAARGRHSMTTPGGDQEDDGPAADRFGTVRVYPEDNPEDPEARRVWKIDATDPDEMKWWDDDDLVWRSHIEVADWPRQSLVDVARVFGHPGTESRDIGNPATLADYDRLKTELAELRNNLRRAAGLPTDADDDDLVILVRDAGIIRDAEHRHSDKATAERDEWKEIAENAQQERDYWRERAGKAEAERDEWKVAADSWKTAAQPTSSEWQPISRDIAAIARTVNAHNARTDRR
ncbi:hypothetical protein AB0L13_16675 [Saccharopolyspora shandongensis]|uniref:hypothetical protein n=1 Tax=Saccharopolyspora shandongensis TaxID=418495 RepID=UPI00341A4AF9